MRPKIGPLFLVGILSILMLGCQKQKNLPEPKIIHDTPPAYTGKTEQETTDTGDAVTETLSDAPVNAESLIETIDSQYFPGLERKPIVRSCLVWPRQDNQLIGLADLHAIRLAVEYQEDFIHQHNKEISRFFRQRGLLAHKEEAAFSGRRLRFERGSTKCSIGWKKDEATDALYYQVGCAEYNSEQENNFKQFYALINAQQETNAAVCVLNENANYASGLYTVIDNEDQSAFWFARKNQDRWEQVLFTREIPACTDLVGFPPQFYWHQCRPQLEVQAEPEAEPDTEAAPES